MTNHIDHYEALFDSNYLRWFDLDGQQRTVTITKVERDVELTMRGGIKSKKPVIHFRETDKPLVMNKTNMGSIAFIHGVRPSEWVGKQVVLIQSTTEMYDSEIKKMVVRECIRIREAAVKQPPMQTTTPVVEADPVKERMKGLYDWMVKLQPNLADWDMFAAWVSVLIGVPTTKENLGGLSMDQIVELEKAAHALVPTDDKERQQPVA